MGRSRRSLSIRRLILTVPRNRLSVLVLGEIGRCEERVGQAIHAANLPGQFVLVDCGPLACAGNLRDGPKTPSPRLREAKSRRLPEP
jgi:transcriptional regulator with AAA-type ATPase domain